MSAPPIEPWLDKRQLAAHLACSLRSLEHALAEGMPHAVIFGRIKFRVSEVEPWLQANGHLTRCDDGTLDANMSVREDLDRAMAAYLARKHPGNAARAETP